MFLASGTFDFLLFVEGANLREVASFVSETVSTIEGVTATATHFMLKTYKFEGVLMKGQDSNERLSIAP
jgi:DNA-binding Lrp family transcriptional regulator